MHKALKRPPIFFFFQKLARKSIPKWFYRRKRIKRSTYFLFDQHLLFESLTKLAYEQR